MTTMTIRPEFRFIVTERAGVFGHLYRIETNWGQTFDDLSPTDRDNAIAEMERQGARAVGTPNDSADEEMGYPEGGQ